MGESNHNRRRGRAIVAAFFLVLLILSNPVQAVDSTYSGILRVFVVEPDSRFSDSYGQPFANAFLDWALVQEVTVTGSDIWTQSLQWNAAAAGWDPIDLANLKIVVALFNIDSVLADAIPPNERWFWMHPVDAVATAAVGGQGTSVGSPGCTHRMLLEVGLNTT
ncbi:MAG: hypothetical protein ABIE70_11290 [bacterium]